MERHVFNTRCHDSETIDYVTDLHKLVSLEILEIAYVIRDRIVCGIHCDKTCSRLLRELVLMLKKTVDICCRAI